MDFSKALLQMGYRNPQNFPNSSLGKDSKCITFCLSFNEGYSNTPSLLLHSSYPFCL